MIFHGYNMVEPLYHIAENVGGKNMSKFGKIDGRFLPQIYIVFNICMPFAKVFSFKLSIRLNSPMFSPTSIFLLYCISMVGHMECCRLGTYVFNYYACCQVLVSNNVYTEKQLYS